MTELGRRLITIRQQVKNEYPDGYRIEKLTNNEWLTIILVILIEYRMVITTVDKLFEVYFTEDGSQVITVQWRSQGGNRPKNLQKYPEVIPDLETALRELEISLGGSTSN